LRLSTSLPTARSVRNPPPPEGLGRELSITRFGTGGRARVRRLATTGSGPALATINPRKDQPWFGRLASPASPGACLCGYAPVLRQPSPNPHRSKITIQNKQFLPPAYLCHSTTNSR
jgi:hypothetical protein